jgi:hypothetical protein
VAAALVLMAPLVAAVFGGAAVQASAPTITSFTESTPSTNTTTSSVFTVHGTNLPIYTTAGCTVGADGQGCVFSNFLLSNLNPANPTGGFYWGSSTLYGQGLLMWGVDIITSTSTALQFSLTMPPPGGDYNAATWYIWLYPTGSSVTTGNIATGQLQAGGTLPVLYWEPVTVGTVQSEAITNLGYNPDTAVNNGAYFGYVEERAALAAGATFFGEGTGSSYLSAILDGSGVGLNDPYVTPVQQGQFAALYQNLGIIPLWADSTVPVAAGVAALKEAAATPLAIENYLVQLDGFSWAAAQAQAAAGFPV